MPAAAEPGRCAPFSADVLCTALCGRGGGGGGGCDGIMARPGERGGGGGGGGGKRCMLCEGPCWSSSCLWPRCRRVGWGPVSLSSLSQLCSYTRSHGQGTDTSYDTIN